MAPRTVNIEVAERKSDVGVPWKVRLVFQQGSSNKFWEALGTSRGAPVTISWGRIGSKGQSTTKDWPYFVKVVREKVGKGYRYSPNTVVRAPSLDFPFDQIRYCCRDRGSAGWLCLDVNRDEVVMLTEAGAEELLIYAQPRVEVL